jgi:uncharacterized protein (DUF488 family)
MAGFYTIGHSTRSTDELLALLGEHSIAWLVDVRRFPGSRRHPHFAQEALAASLGAAGLEYVHEPDLGGFRKPLPDSPNKGWQSPGFQGYADHMETLEFKEALGRLIERGTKENAAIMCAEVTPWRCHRQLISDAIVARGHQVLHILAQRKVERHVLNAMARIDTEGRLIYPEPPADQLGLFADSRK